MELVYLTTKITGSKNEKHDIDQCRDKWFIIEHLVVNKYLRSKQQPKAMISVLSTTSKYILQPSLLDMHRQSLAWLSASALWKRELAFFQKLLDTHSPRFSAEEDKQKISHFQNLIIYYNGEVVDGLRKKLRDHESQLAHSLQKENEADTRYYNDHRGLMEEAASLEHSFSDLKHELFTFIEKAI